MRSEAEVRDFLEKAKIATDNIKSDTILANQFQCYINAAKWFLEIEE